MLDLILCSALRIMGLIKKELLSILMDPSNRKVLVVPIVMQCVLFGYGATYHLEHIPYSVYIQSQDSTCHDIVSDLSSTPHFELIETCYSMECLKNAVDSQKALIGLYFDSDFKSTREIGVILDARNTASANTALMYLNGIIAKLNYKKTGIIALNTNTRFLFNENNITRYTILVGMCLGLSVIQVLLLSSLSISKEREEGSYDMMIMTPARPFEMLIGKAVPPVAIAFFQSVLLVLICRFYFDIPLRGNFFSICFIIIIFSIAVVGIGLAISALSKTTMQSLIVAFTLCLVIIMTSGMITSVDNMPEGFKYVAYINPLYYGIEAMWRVFLQGKSLFLVLHLMVPLIGVGAVTMAIASYLFRNRLE